MTNGVRVEALVFERGVPQQRFRNVFMQDETNTKAGQPGATITVLRIPQRISSQLLAAQ